MPSHDCKTAKQQIQTIYAVIYYYKEKKFGTEVNYFSDQVINFETSTPKYVQIYVLA